MAAAFAQTPFEHAAANSSSFSKTRAANVAAGSVLFCFTWQYNATQTCTGVADDLGGTWVKAFGPVRAGTNNGATNASIYGWYKLNSAAGGTPTNGTVTATWSGSAVGGIVIGEVTGLAGGGALDKQVSALQDGTLVDVSFGTTGTLAQAVEAMAMFVIASGSSGLASPHTGLSVDKTIDSYNYERTYRAITSATTSIDAGYNGSGNLTVVGGLMAFKDAAAGPNITAVSSSSPRSGESITVTGTLFGATQGTKLLKIGGVTQTISSWSNTSIIATVSEGTNKFGAALNVEVYDGATLVSNSFALTSLLPRGGFGFVDISAPNLTAANRITSSADIAAGDQIEFSDAADVVVSSDATFNVTAALGLFSARVWTAGSGWGSSAVQTLVAGIPLLSAPGVSTIGSTTARPRVTITY